MEILLLNNNSNDKLSEPPLILPPPPPPPPPYALHLSSARSSFSYLFLKQSAFNSYTYFLRNFIDQFSDNSKNNNNINILTKQSTNSRQICKQIDISSLNYLISYELNKIKHSTINSLELNNNYNKSKNRFNSEANYLFQQANFNTTTTITNKGMHELIEPKNSLQFLFNILIVPIVFFSIFIIIIIVTLISKL